MWNEGTVDAVHCTSSSTHVTQYRLVTQRYIILVHCTCRCAYTCTCTSIFVYMYSVCMYLLCTVHCTLMNESILIHLDVHVHVHDEAVHVLLCFLYCVGDADHNSC